MKQEKQFEIRFASLEVGLHRFTFDIDDNFFEELKSSEINNGSVKVDVELIKEDYLLVFEFNINGSVDVSCDRCAHNLELPVKCTNRLIVKFGDEVYEETDEIIVISAKENSIDVSPYIFEYIHLQLPQKRVHKEGDCDSETIARLNVLNGVEKGIDTVDPRWDALKKIKLGT